MKNWNDRLAQLQADSVPAILVSVESTVGSTPREVGARMIVTQQQNYGSIGGGNLEYQACQIARDQLQSGASHQLKRFPLGAGLGQCCGGLVNLMFEPLDQSSDWKSLRDDKPLPDLFLFGAGHVGKAVIRAMQDLPLNIFWVDNRDGMFPAKLPFNVEAIATDSPEAEIDAAKAGSYFLVMTHDHSLDQSLSEQILKRDDFRYFGLIGSRAKRRNFETRMKRRGIDSSRFSRMTCPIGIEGITSKQPELIAISVVAEIVQVFDQAQIEGQSFGTLGGRQ